jgi:hypothetical protein
MTAAARNWLKENWVMVAVPVLLLYVLCYRNKVARGQLVLRAVALACLGIYAATYLVPEPVQAILPQLGVLRIAGLAVLMLIELRLLIAAIRIVWGRDGSVEQVQAASGAPAWIARLMVMEARFWKRLWRLIRRR